MAKILLTAAYERRLSEIEDFVFETTSSVEAIVHFLDDHDRALAFLARNPETPALHPTTGDRSWVFGEGRYRLFFQAISAPFGEITLYLTHLIDNRQANLDVYPGNSMPTFDEDS